LDEKMIRISAAIQFFLFGAWLIAATLLGFPPLPRSRQPPQRAGPLRRAPGIRA
jgi:hypothetical protein